MMANPAYTVDEFVFQLKDSRVRMIATQKSLLKVAAEAARRVGIAEDHIILTGDDRDDTGKFKHFASIRNVAGTNRYRRTGMQPDDLAFLVNSSSTTGQPKGVMFIHKNIVSNILQLSAAEGDELSGDGGRDGQGDQILALLPFYHAYGQISLLILTTLLTFLSLNCCLHQSLYNGCTTIVMAKFDIEDFAVLSGDIELHSLTLCLRLRFYLPNILWLIITTFQPENDEFRCGTHDKRPCGSSICPN